MNHRVPFLRQKVSIAPFIVEIIGIVVLAVIGFIYFPVATGIMCTVMIGVVFAAILNGTADNVHQAHNSRKRISPDETVAFNMEGEKSDTILSFRSEKEIGQQGKDAHRG